MHDPEGLFYYARHCGMVHAAAPALAMIKRARAGGFWSSETLQSDAAFAEIRKDQEFIAEIVAAQTLEAEARKDMADILGHKLRKL